MGDFELEFRRVEAQLRARRTKIKHIDAVNSLALICSMADEKVANLKVTMIVFCVLSLGLGIALGSFL